MSSASPVINVDTTDLFEITALATSVTSMTISGTPNQCQKLMIRIADGGIERAITWGSAFINSGIAALPASTRSAWAQSGAAQLNVSLMFDSYVPAWVAKAVGWW